jgi:hypothetical protein
MSLALLLLNLLPGVIGQFPGISTTIKSIIGDITASLGAIFASGVVSQPSVNTALAAWAGVLAALKAQANLPAATLAAISQLEIAVQAALLQDEVLAKSVNWGAINPIAPVA